METQQNAAEHASVESEQDMTQPTEELDVSRTPLKEKSTLAQVSTLLRKAAPSCKHPKFCRPFLHCMLCLMPLAQKTPKSGHHFFPAHFDWLRIVQTLEEGISSAAKAVEHSIKHGQPLDFVDTRPVTDLLNEVGSGDLSALDPSISGWASSELQRLSHACCFALSPSTCVLCTVSVRKLFKKRRKSVSCVSQNNALRP